MFNEEELKIVKEKALENHIPIIMDDTLEKIEEPSLTTINNKNIYQVVYKGTSDGIEYDFILSSIDYKDDDILSLVIQVVEVGNYKNNKEKLSNILSSIIKEKY